MSWMEEVLKELDGGGGVRGMEEEAPVDERRRVMRVSAQLPQNDAQQRKQTGDTQTNTTQHCTRKYCTRSTACAATTQHWHSRVRLEGQVIVAHEEVVRAVGVTSEALAFARHSIKNSRDCKMNHEALCSAGDLRLAEQVFINPENFALHSAVSARR